MPSVKKGSFFSLICVDICASGSFWMSTLMPILPSDSFTSAAIGSAVEAWPTLKLNVVEKPSAIPAAFMYAFALSRSSLIGCGNGNALVVGLPSGQLAPNGGVPRADGAALRRYLLGAQ